MIYNQKYQENRFYGGDIKLLVLDVENLREQVEKSGLKQKVISEKAGLSETALCLILQGKRKCETGEYASICAALGVPVDAFLKPRSPEEKGA